MAGTIDRSELGKEFAEKTSRPSVIFSGARWEDAADICKLLRESSMPGPIRLAFTREPNFFASHGILGATDTIVLARRGNDLAGMGRCLTRTLSVSGEDRRVGYLCELRVAPGEKGGMTLLRGGFREFAEMAESREPEVFFTSIGISNTRGRKVLERAWRCGLPRYEAVADLVTFAVPTKRERKKDRPPQEGFTVSQLRDFLRLQARRFNLALPWDDSTWELLKKQSVGPEDFVVVKRAEKILAAGGLWDQRAVRQTLIKGYSGVLSAGRPLINLWSRLRGKPLLPKTGSVLSQIAVLGAFGLDGNSFSELWLKLQAKAACRGVDWLTWSTDARDPDVKVIRGLDGTREYFTRLYEVRWAHQETQQGLLRDSIFRPEVSLL